MKKGKLFKIVFLLFVCFWAILPVSAVEMWEGRPQRWDIFVNGAYQTISSDSIFPSSHPCYGTIYSAVTRFNNTSPSSVRANYTTGMGANVQYFVANQSYWNSIVDGIGVFASTVPTDNYGRRYTCEADYFVPGIPEWVYFQKADIYYNPDTGVFNGTTYNTHVVIAMHELGHAYGLGHDPGTVMNDSPLPQYASGLTARDKQALQAFYGGT